MANGLVLRKSVDSLPAAELTALRSSYTSMQQIMDNRGYNYHAGLHGLPSLYCWHNGRSLRGQIGNLFLPWHRAYLLFFENALRDLDPNVSVPWWDWTAPQTSQVGIPPAFAQANVDGQPNPLYSARIFVPTANPPLDRPTRRYPLAPNQLQNLSTLINAPNIGVLSLTQFEDFSNQLEDIHDQIHGWTGGNNGTIGGDMGSVAVAAFDPIFWSHHCMIDRIWYLWQLRHGMNNIPQQYLNMTLAPFPLTVRDVLSINSLGYEYAVSSTVIATSGNN